MDPIFALGIVLPPPGSRALLRDLHRQLRAAILDGRLKPGLRLPATRALAASLGVSRNTTVAAYELLLGEGYLAGRAGAGTYVADILPRPNPAPPATAADARLAPFWREAAAGPGPGRCAADFRLGAPEVALFPFEIWRRLSARAWRALARGQAAYAAPEGPPALREAIARHVSFARAVACRAEDVIVTAGAQQGFDLLARILVTRGATRVAVEDPGYPPLRAAFAAAGAEVVPVPVDAEGIAVDRLPEGVGVVCVTPSHQFPLGITMSARRRADLLDFARARRCVVIEDDYDSELRFGGRPLDALQTLDRAGSVFYVGTFSKSLFPALRLGFVVAPAWARGALAEARRLADWHGPTAVEETLAAFIGEGHLVRHIRRMRAVYAGRRTALLGAIEAHGRGRLEPIPSAAGLHLSARLSAPVDAAAVAARAGAEGIGVEPLGRYAVLAPAPNGFALGYGTITADRIGPAVARLATLLA
jgi:GntR family transcriptional regulator/MocR family aminotransferase